MTDTPRYLGPYSRGLSDRCLQATNRMPPPRIVMRHGRALRPLSVWSSHQRQRMSNAILRDRVTGEIESAYPIGALMDVAQVLVGTPNAYRHGRSGAVNGGIWVAVGAVAFPSEDWDDYCVVVLEAWVDAVTALISGEGRGSDIRFMEGPHLARLARTDDDIWVLTLVEDYLTPRIRYEGTVSRRPFVQSILSASAQVLDTCKERGWGNADTARLELAVRRLGSMVRVLG